ncbi:acyl-CoA dehydrogenase [Embleya hyalina]|uniref:Acyl-CoA dehydrogenase n=1 Tax=Embleya hyalina TaxID=516124 RepID=A0A401YNG2_9ACTN|nr:acyl-CoA dehydrogenase [Embleya hyalina]
MTENDGSREAGTVPLPDPARLAKWYARHAPGDLGPELTVEPVTGGRSNLNFAIFDGRTVRILRRPPLGHVQATAHDMRREFVVMRALAHTDVPVPETMAYCDDPEVIGAPFYVMERVAGTPFRTAEQLKAEGPAATTRICEVMIDTLVRLHAVDPRTIGLAEFGRPQGFVRRQVERWGRQMAGSLRRPIEGADELLHALGARAGTVADVSLDDGTAAIVHGDYRLDNLLTSDGRVTAILDWEMATLGDPLTDLALLVVYSSLTEIFDVPELGDASRSPGYLGPEATIARYADQSRRPVEDLSFHLALAHYKLAVICEGIHRRYTEGKTPGGAFGTVGQAVQPLVAAGLAALGTP